MAQDRSTSRPARDAAAPLGAPQALSDDPRRWIALVFVALAQLMVALDATIVNIALPSAQRALHGSDAERQWVITAYTLAFGGLLLAGGRLSDMLGRKRAFVIGLGGFAGASALGGASANLGMLIGARALQGSFAALLAPTALSLVAVTFTEARERAKAFAVYGGIAGSGGAAGLILGGALTEYLTWRWCLYVNIPIAIVAAAGGWILLSDARSASQRHFDVPGLLLAVAGLVSVVEACAQAVSDGWRARPVMALLIAGAASLTLFVVRESRATNPMLPLRIVRNRNRGGAYVSAGVAVAGMFGVFLLLTYYFQVVLHYSPLRAGLAFLPLSAAALFSSGAIASRLLPRVPPRALIVPGLLVAATGMALLSQLTTDSSYMTLVLPVEVLLGLGMGCVFVPAFSIATADIDRRDAGVASAMVTTVQQIGGSIGIALLNTIATSAAAGYAASLPLGAADQAKSLVHGYSVSAGWAAGVLVVAAFIVAILVNAGKPAGHAAAAQGSTSTTNASGGSTSPQAA
jgi:EmrB/QacA subfamily drug resistance transporter